MTRPEDIPEDVWKAGMKVAVEMEIHAALSTRTDAKAEVIARAIMAAKAEEREACARVAEEYRQRGFGAQEPDKSVFGWGRARTEIAQSIRSRK